MLLDTGGNCRSRTFLLLPLSILINSLLFFTLHLLTFSLDFTLHLLTSSSSQSWSTVAKKLLLRHPPSFLTPRTDTGRGPCPQNASNALSSPKWPFHQVGYHGATSLFPPSPANWWTEGRGEEELAISQFPRPPLKAPIQKRGAGWQPIYYTPLRLLEPKNWGIFTDFGFNISAIKTRLGCGPLDWSHVDVCVQKLDKWCKFQFAIIWHYLSRSLLHVIQF